jgi:hypothetical protein
MRSIAEADDQSCGCRPCRSSIHDRAKARFVRCRAPAERHCGFRAPGTVMEPGASSTSVSSRLMGCETLRAKCARHRSRSLTRIQTKVRSARRHGENVPSAFACRWLIERTVGRLLFNHVTDRQSVSENCEAYPRMLFILGCVGLAVIIHAFVIVRDHGRHINRTFARADAARDGESAPLKIWQAGNEAEGESLPPICRQLLYVVGAFGLAFAAFIVLALRALLVTS